MTKSIQSSEQLSSAFGLNTVMLESFSIVKCPTLLWKDREPLFWLDPCWFFPANATFLSGTVFRDRRLFFAKLNNKSNVRRSINGGGCWDCVSGCSVGFGGRETFISSRNKSNQRSHPITNDWRFSKCSLVLEICLSCWYCKAALWLLSWCSTLGCGGGLVVA